MLYGVIRATKEEAEQELTNRVVAFESICARATGMVTAWVRSPRGTEEETADWLLRSCVAAIWSACDRGLAGHKRIGTLATTVEAQGNGVTRAQSEPPPEPNRRPVAPDPD